MELGGVGELHAPFFGERRTLDLVRDRVAGNPAPPDFLWNLVALANFMRLSLGKGAPAALCKTVWQEIPGREMSKRCAVCALIRLLQKFLGKFLGKFFGEFFGFGRFFFEWLLVFAIDGGPEDGAADRGRAWTRNEK